VRSGATLKKDGRKLPTPASRRMALGWMAHRLRAALQGDLPPYALLHLDPAMAGDVVAAGQLTIAAPNHLRGAIAVLLYLDAPLASLRAYLEAAWLHDHRHVMETANTATRLRAMFRRASYPVPPGLPDPVRLYRGASALSQKAAARGYAWTWDRDVACWFATRFAEANGRPLVLTADVPLSRVSLFTNERGEREALVIGGCPEAVVDGTAADWREGYVRYETAKNGALRLSLQWAAAERKIGQ